MSKPIPDSPHPRAIRAPNGWLVRRRTRATVRVTDGNRELALTMGRGADVDEAVAIAQIADPASWTRLPSRSGRTRTDAERKASGAVLVKAWLSPETAALLAPIVKKQGTIKASIEWLLRQSVNR